MRRLTKIIPVFAMILIGASCSMEKHEGGQGYLKIAIDSEETPTLVVKGGEKNKAEKVFSLKIKNKSTGAEKNVPDHRALATEPLRLPADNYTITASSGEEVNAAWNSPLYSGTTTIAIRPEQTSTASISCGLKNTMVTIELPENMDNYFSEYKINVDNGSGSPLVFSKEAGNIKDTAYFAVTGNLNWTFSLVNKDGTKYSAETISRTDVKAKQHYHLKFSFGSPEDILGGAAFTLTLDESVNEQRHPLIVDFNNSGLPSVSADFPLNNTLSVPMGSNSPKTLSFSAPKGIKSLVILTDDKVLKSKGLAAGTELTDADAAIIQRLSDAGIVAASVPFGSLTAAIEFSTLLSKLPIGKYSFSVSLTDIKNRGVNCDVKIEIISPVDAEALSATPWAKFAILSGSWFTEERPAGLRFQYKKTGTEEWTDFTQGLSFDSVKKTFSGELYGLEAGTSYVFKAVSDKDKNTREVGFSTESAEDLHNLSFDSWYKNGSCWYPNESSSYKVWDSANPGTSSFGVVPTTPEEGDVAVSGPGKKAARLESTTAFGQFTAGNIYVGEFIKVSGLGAILKWGHQFNSRPLALHGYYKYKPQVINYAKAPYTDLKGSTDNCQIKIFLTDWTGMFEINTSKKIFVSDDDEHIIALGSLVSSNTDAEYVKFSIPLQYRSKTRKPNFIVITGAASRYGDYFTGGKGSVLLLDEFSLVYDPALLTEEERVLAGYR